MHDDNNDDALDNGLLLRVDSLPMAEVAAVRLAVDRIRKDMLDDTAAYVIDFNKGVARLTRG